MVFVFRRQFNIFGQIKNDVIQKRNIQSSFLGAFIIIVGPKIKTERADELEWDYTAFLYPWNDAYRGGVNSFV